jgi:hypothetical protein
VKRGDASGCGFRRLETGAACVTRTRDPRITKIFDV